MRAILKREFRAYFQSPLGYVFIGAMYFFTGYYFFTYNLYGNTTDMSTLFSLLFSVVLFLVPVLTMRLLSEERRSKTEQTLLTAPISRLGIVLSKYLAALCVYLIAISGTLVMAVVLEIYSAPDWPVVLGNFIGLLLLGSALIAICLFISSITESQVIAGVTTFAALLILYLWDGIAGFLPGVLGEAASQFSVLAPFDDLVNNSLLHLDGIVLYLSLIGLFLFLTVQTLQKRRWA